MKKTILTLILFFTFLTPAQAATLGQTLSGSILLQVEEHGEAWYVYPENFQRYYLKDGDAAYSIMRFLSLGITNTDLEKIPAVENTTEMNASTSNCSSHPLANDLKGRILLQVEEHGEAWYIDVKKCKRIYLKDGQAAYDVMRFLGLGITNENLAKVEKASDSVEPINGTDTDTASSGYIKKTVSVGGSSFVVDMVTIDLSSPELQIITDTLSDVDCDTNCPIQSLKEYVVDQQGFAGIHGSYFCPSDYSGCSGQTNYFFAPVFDSNTKTLINKDQLVYPTTGSLWIFDQNNTVHFLKSTQDFSSIEEFEASNEVIIQAAISNLPALIYNAENIIQTQILDDKQRFTRSSRGGMAVKGGTLYLMIAHNATVIDLAAIMESMSMEQGLNLDGGGSSALYYSGEYKVGPGRDIPNAIIFK